MRLLAGLTAAIAVFGASAANAGVTTFVFQNPGADTPVAGVDSTGGTCNSINVSSIDLCDSNGSGLSYLKGGLTLLAEGFGTGTTALLQDLAPNNSGLAVLSEGETSSDDQIQMSAMESIVFTFGEVVTLTGIDFNAGGDTNCATFNTEGPCGTFDLYVDMALYGSFVAADDMIFDIVGTIFKIVATGQGAGFTIGSISAEVPVPAALPLLLSGIAGLGFASRRRKTA